MMKTMKISLLGALLATGLASAQTASTAPPSEPRAGVGTAARLVRILNLTPDQQAQAKAIFQAGRAEAGPVDEQMKQARKALADAANSNAPEAQIDQLSAAIGPLATQLAAIRAKTMAKFQSILTPEQQAKLAAAGGLRPARHRRGSDAGAPAFDRLPRRN